MWKINWNWFILAWKKAERVFSWSLWLKVRKPPTTTVHCARCPAHLFPFKRGKDPCEQTNFIHKVIHEPSLTILTRFSKSNRAQWLFGIQLHRKVEVGTECKFSRFASERRSALQTMAAGDKQPQSWRRHREGNYKRKNDMQSPFQTGGFWWKTFRQDKVRTQTNCCSVRLRCGPVPRWRTGRGF